MARTWSSNALHGRYGEDGCIQGVLEIMCVPYTHSGVLASAIAMDKPLARHIFASLGLRVAEGRVIERRSLASGDPMPRPYVVKPIDQGSSIGSISCATAIIWRPSRRPRRPSASGC